MIYRNIYSALLALAIVIPVAAQDNIDRTVVVERDFQPTVQQAGKILQTPTIIEPKQDSVEVVYSTFYQPYQTDFTIPPLGYSEVRFARPNALNGFLRAGIGHSNSQLNFDYRIQSKREASLMLRASHIGQWGRKTLSNSGLGMTIDKVFPQAQLYFNVDARNIFFSRYGQYFEYNTPIDSFDISPFYKDGQFTKRYKDFDTSAKDLHWEVQTAIGVKSLPKQTIQYALQTGYETFVMGNIGIEHQIATTGFLEASVGTYHHVGANLLLRNRFYSISDGFDPTIARAYGNDTITRNHHVLKLRPYYAYDGKRVRLHAGVNIDLALGKTGSAICLPSPDVHLEANLTKDWLVLYAGATGDYKLWSLQEDYTYNRYLHPELELTDTCQRTWQPIDASIGFVIRPIESLKLDIYAHYILTLNDVFYNADSLGYFTLMGASHQRWKVGASLSYHYKDIVSVSVNGNYNHYVIQTDSLGNRPLEHVLYRPIWEIGCRIDAKINTKFSLYSENVFAGGRYAKVADSYIPLKPTIDLNLGVQYNINKWLALYLQINNYLHCQTDLFYGYQTQGANFLIGVSYSF